MQELKRIIKEQDPRGVKFGEIRFPINYLTYNEYKHCVADRPNLWVEIDIMVLPKETVSQYNLMASYVVGCDVYSRYCMYYINPEATNFNTKGSSLQNFKGIVDQIYEAFDEKYPKFVSTDSEFDKSEVREFCESNDITLITSPPGTINATPIIDRIIIKLRKFIALYIDKYHDKMIARKREGYTKMECSVKLMNAVIYFYNRKYNSSIKGIPAEIYFDIDVAKVPLANVVDYPQFKVGDKVFMRLRPRIKHGKVRVSPAPLIPGIPGEIKEKISNTLYLIETPNGELYAKWYEFYKIPDEIYEKLKRHKYSLK
ncbi:MAG: transposase family protein [Candidatus Bathyarchaeota archaeon]|nr:transposase family protein [Candidatus Bathyarchaeota archaeon]